MLACQTLNMMIIIFVYRLFAMIFFFFFWLLMGTLCFVVLDHLMWSNDKRTELGRDASMLQTDTSSKGRRSASHAEVSSF